MNRFDIQLWKMPSPGNRG